MRNAPDAEDGCLRHIRVLIHDRDPRCRPAVRDPLCQGRSKIRPRWRRKTRPAGHWTECLKAAVRGKASGPRGGRVLAGVLAVCEAIAVAVQLQDVDVMGESVEECTG